MCTLTAFEINKLSIDEGLKGRMIPDSSNNPAVSFKLSTGEYLKLIRHCQSVCISEKRGREICTFRGVVCIQYHLKVIRTQKQTHSNQNGTAVCLILWLIVPGL